MALSESWWVSYDGSGSAPHRWQIACTLALKTKINLISTWLALAIATTIQLARPVLLTVPAQHRLLHSVMSPPSRQGAPPGLLTMRQAAAIGDTKKWTSAFCAQTLILMDAWSCHHWEMSPSRLPSQRDAYWLCLRVPFPTQFPTQFSTMQRKFKAVEMVRFWEPRSIIWSFILRRLQVYAARTVHRTMRAYLQISLHHLLPLSLWPHWTMFILYPQPAQLLWLHSKHLHHQPLLNASKRAGIVSRVLDSTDSRTTTEKHWSHENEHGLRQLSRVKMNGEIYAKMLRVFTARAFLV